MAKRLTKWLGWALFGGPMVVVFLLGLVVSSLLEHRAEVGSVFNNRRTLSSSNSVFNPANYCVGMAQVLPHWADKARRSGKLVKI